ncbi:reprolysin-like metallopeptidase [Stieleria neptunia]|nr:zinc-dependent metalloprotease family protein [Stieleria neptunia]
MRRRSTRRLVKENLEHRIVLSATIGNNIGVGDQIQNFRLAIAATAEYTALLGGQANAFAAIESFVRDVNEIFEAELSIHFDLVSGTNTVFTDSATDGYTNGNTEEMLSQNTGVLDDELGNSAYDVGHVFGTATSGGAGLAGLGVVNSPTRKGEGASISTNPQGADWVRLVAHEIGHQFDAEHTFNANAFASAKNNRDAGSAYEPASGTTLMSYAGISGADDLQNDSDPYFHAASFESIQSFLASSAPPDSLTPSGNAIPVVSGGTDYTIPAGTPFQLTATGSDADSGDRLTYTWEQLDLGPEMSLPISDNGSSPLFRSFPPGEDPTRVFPRLSDLAANVNTAQLGEALPTTDRSLNFRATVRDGAGGVHSDDVLLTVVDTGTPFAVTSPNTAVSWTGGTSQTIVWNVGGTDANGIDVSNVVIDLSLDGGLTYPLTLAATTPNDGSESITVPNITAGQARVRVRADGNVFFDISDADLSITANSASPGLTVTQSDGNTRVGEDGLLGSSPIDSYTIALNTTPTGPVDVTVNADSQTEVSTDGVTFTPSVTVTRTDMTAATIYVRGVDDTIQEGVHGGSITHSVSASTDPAYPLGGIGNSVAVTIADDELQPVVGVDFDIQSGAPLHWTEIVGVFSADLQTLPREDGSVSSIGLEFQAGPSLGSSTATPPVFPLHSPPLDGVDGVISGSDYVRLTWTGLTPFTDYNLYTFLTENFIGGRNAIQEVRISAAVSPDPVIQNTSALGSGLLVNQGLADSSKPIEDDRVMAQADANGEIRLEIFDTSGLSQAPAISAAAIQEVGPDIAGISVIQTDDETTVSDSATSDSFDVVLKKPPTGTVVIDISNEDVTETSVTPSTLTFDATNWNTPQTVTVHGVADGEADGAQSVRVRLSVDTASTTDSDYGVVGDRLLPVTASDDLQSPLIGIDFEDSPAPNLAPANWNIATNPSTGNFVDLVDEDGSMTAVDLSIHLAGGVGKYDDFPLGSLPDHPTSLAELAGGWFSTSGITMTWSDLAPNTEYDVWLFAEWPYGNPIGQSVTVSGASVAQSPFVMAPSVNQLLINSASVDVTRTLADDAVRATSNAAGEIQITVTRDSGADYSLISGAAIQEIPPVPPGTADLSVTTHGDENGPVNVVYTVTLSRPNETGSPITFDMDDLLTGSATSGEDYAAIPGDAKISVPDGASVGSITVSVMGDAFVETEETIDAQISNPSVSEFVIGDSNATATIADDDVSVVTVAADPATVHEDAAESIVFTLTRTNVVTNSPALDIHFDLAGDATFANDYNADAVHTATFAAGQSTTTVTVTPTADSVVEPDESVTLTLAEDDDYQTGAAAEATATIRNDDPGGAAPQVYSVVYFNEDADSELNHSPDGTGQRSVIRKIRVTFSGPTSVPIGAVTDDSFILESTSGRSRGTRVGLEVVRSDVIAGQQVVVLKFTGTELVEAISRKKRNVDAMLVDGEYRLTIEGAKLGIDANGAGYGVNATDDFFRLFGDSDGDRDVDGTDSDRFFADDETAGQSSLFDFDAKPQKKAVDRSEFINRFGTQLF